MVLYGFYFLKLESFPTYISLLQKHVSLVLSSLILITDTENNLKNFLFENFRKKGRWDRKGTWVWANVALLHTCGRRAAITPYSPGCRYCGFGGEKLINHPAFAKRGMVSDRYAILPRGKGRGRFSTDDDRCKNLFHQQISIRVAPNVNRAQPFHHHRRSR